PQLAQKRAPSRFSCPHDSQFILHTLRLCFGRWSCPIWRQDGTSVEARGPTVGDSRLDCIISAEWETNEALSEAGWLRKPGFELSVCVGHYCGTRPHLPHSRLGASR